MPDRKHAMVVGGSLAGLFAARALSPHFERVTLIERDHLPEGIEPRKGVPQGRHIHVLLARGTIVVEGLFPGMQDDLAAAGAPLIDWTGDVRMFNYGAWGPREYSGVTTRMCTRDLLDWAVRRRVRALPNVEVLEERDVTGLTASDDHRRVTGVTLRQRGTGAADERLEADLVVDASGRSSRLPNWLEALGYERPREITINPFSGYASRLYRIPSGWQADWKGLLIRSMPPASSRGAGVLPVEGDRWMVNLAAAMYDYPPTDDAGFLEFARSLPSPEIYDALRQAEPLTPVYGYRRTENHLRYYDRLRRFPDGLAVMGDAVCAFNPVYGQGMTVAAMEAALLDRRLRLESSAEGWSRRFQLALGRLIATPWLMSTGEDLRYPTTEGDRPGALSQLMHRYIDRVLQLGNRDSDVHTAFMRVSHLLDSPAHLFRPGIMIRALAPLPQAAGDKGRDRPYPQPAGTAVRS